MKILNKLVTRIAKTGTLVLSGLGVATPALAVGQTTNISLNAPAQFSNLPNLTVPGAVAFGIQAVLVIAGILFFFMLVWGGIEWIMSGGDKAGNENARKRITNALIGLAIVFSAWAIVNLITVVFGVNLLNLSIPSILQLSQ